MGLELTDTASRCTTGKAVGSHEFEIDGYSLKKGMGVGKFVRSATFTVGGYNWAIRFYPDGFTEDAKDHVAICLEFMSSNAKVRAFHDMGLVKHATGLMGAGFVRSETMVFTSTAAIDKTTIPRVKLEGSKYIQDDRLIIKCVLTVLKESQVFQTKGSSEIEVPPSNITEDLGKLLGAKEGADVTFSVGGETFQAHKIVLAMRSPVFRAEFYGPMLETRMQCVAIEDMQPAVFKALLHFIYTDSLPNLDDLVEDGDANCEMMKHLLVAADRYAIDRLKLICQNVLAKNLDVENVSTTLALADQFNCDRLKDVCFDFIVSSNEKEAVVATNGYANLKRTCPSVLVDLFEKTSRLRKA